MGDRIFGSVLGFHQLTNQIFPFLILLIDLLMRPNSYYEKSNFIKGKLKSVGYISTIYFCDKAKGPTYRSKYKK